MNETVKTCSDDFYSDRVRSRIHPWFVAHQDSVVQGNVVDVLLLSPQ